MMKSMVKLILVISVLFASSTAILAGVVNGGFEVGTFAGWEADPNWVVVDNWCGYYSGWSGKYWAWSGGKGEPATGNLKSKPFVLDKEAVRMMISGWNSVFGTGKPRKWNYVTLNLADGTEIDRIYAPNTTTFVPVYLDGSAYIGKEVYITAVDDADQPTFSMLCIDDVQTVSLPASYKQPVPPLPASDPAKTLKLEDDLYVVEVSRENGAVTRIADKVGGIELIREPRLAGIFKFSLPIPGKEAWQTLEANYIIGAKQKLTSFDASPRKLTLHWQGPFTSSLDKKHDASATATIELANGGVLFNLMIDNKTPYQIGEVYFPMIGGLQGIGKTIGQLKSTEFVRPTGEDAASSSDIFRMFANFSWLGDQGPEQFYTYPKDITESWIEFHAAKLKRSAYIGAHDTKKRQKIVHMELFPGNSGTIRADGNWPRPEELNGQPVGVVLDFAEFANHPTGKPFETSPVFIKFHDGDWQEGRWIYRGFAK